MSDSLDNLDTNSKEDFFEKVYKKKNIFHMNNECLLNITNYLEGIDKAKLWLVNRDLFHQISGKLAIIIIRNDSIRNVNAFSRVHSLKLSYCRNITDVSALGGVHTLYLSQCSKITDVSALCRVHTLNLSGCDNIIDVSALGGVHTLDLEGCDSITDVSSLNNVPNLTLPLGIQQSIG